MLCRQEHASKRPNPEPPEFLKPGNKEALEPTMEEIESPPLQDSNRPRKLPRFQLKKNSDRVHAGIEMQTL